MTKAEKTAHFNAIAGLGCICCRLVHHVYSPATIHHLTGIKWRSTGKKASDEHVIPLCPTHHTGSQGIHHIGMRPFEKMFGTQEYLMDYCNEILRGLH